MSRISRMTQYHMGGNGGASTSTVIVEPPVSSSSKTWTYTIVGIIMIILIGYFLYKYVYLPNTTPTVLHPCTFSCNPAACNPLNSGLPNCDPTICIPYSCPLPDCDATTCKPAQCNPLDSGLPSCNALLCKPPICPNLSLSNCDPNKCNTAACNPDDSGMPSCDPLKCNPQSCPTPTPTLPYCGTYECYDASCNTPDSGIPDCDPQICISIPQSNCPVILPNCDPTTCKPITCNPFNSGLPSCDPSRCIPYECPANTELPYCHLTECLPARCNPIDSGLPSCDPSECNSYGDQCPIIEPTVPSMYYGISSKIAPNVCIKSPDSNLADGTSIVTGNCAINTDATERWQYNVNSKQFMDPHQIKCLDLKSYDIANNTPVIVMPCNADANSQQWISDEQFRFLNVRANKCLSVYNNDPCPGTSVVIDNCNNNLNQQWTQINSVQGPSTQAYPFVDQTYRIQQPISTKCLRTPGGAYTQMWPCDNADAEKWRFLDAGNGSVRVQNPSSGKCLTNNTTYLSNCNDGDNDRWTIQGDPKCNFGLKNVSNSQCIRAPNGDFTQLYPCDGASAEYWKVIP
jgi:hypothetical protein